MENNSVLKITYEVITYLVAFTTIYYAVKKMIEINTDYKYYFGLGISLIVLLILSLFNQWWIIATLKIITSLCIYFFLHILINSENETNKIKP